MNRLPRVNTMNMPMMVRINRWFREDAKDATSLEKTGMSSLRAELSVSDIAIVNGGMAHVQLSVEKTASGTVPSAMGIMVKERFQKKPFLKLSTGTVVQS